MGSANDSVLIPSLPSSLTRLVGIPGAGVNVWGITRKRGDKYTRLEWSGEDGTRLRVWPLSELSVETIRERWGAGDYRIQWFVEDPESEEPSQRMRAGGTGPQFGIDEPEAPRVVAAPPVAAPLAPTASSLPAGLGAALELMAVFDARANAQLERTMTAAAAMGRGGGGLDAQTMLLFLQQSQGQTEKLIAAMHAQHAEQMAAVQTQIAALRSELESDEDEDDDGKPSAATGLAVAAAAPFLKKGQTLKSALVNYAAEHPEEVFSVLKSVPEMMAQFGKLQAQAAQVAAPASAPVQRPRATVVRSVEVESRPPPPPTGMNSLFHGPPASAPATVSGDADGSKAAAE